MPYEPFNCKHCGKEVQYDRRRHGSTIAIWKTKQFCSQKCHGLHRMAEKPPFNCSICGVLVEYVHSKHRRLDWKNKTTCTLACHNIKQKGVPHPHAHNRKPDPPPKPCEGCGELIHFDRAKHQKPWFFENRVVTCGKKECRYGVGSRKQAAKLRRVPDVKCIRPECTNTFRAYGRKKHCSQICAGKTSSERRFKLKYKANKPKTCQMCGCKMTIRANQSWVAFKKVKYCMECHPKMVALNASSFEAIIAKKTQAVRRQMAGITRQISEEHRAAVSKAMHDPILNARKRLLDYHRRGYDRSKV